MSDDHSLTRKQFLRAFAALAAYATPAVAVLGPTACSGGGGSTGATGAGGNDPYCSYDYDDAGALTSVSCSYPNGSCSYEPPATSCTASS